VEWNHQSTWTGGLPDGEYIVIIKVTGRKNAKSANWEMRKTE
jgi:hypothetical protein